MGSSVGFCNSTIWGLGFGIWDFFTRKLSTRSGQIFGSKTLFKNNDLYTPLTNCLVDSQFINVLDGTCTCIFIAVHRQCNLELMPRVQLCLGGDSLSHIGVFRGARFPSLPTSARSAEDNIPFPSLANHIAHCTFHILDS